MLRRTLSAPPSEKYVGPRKFVPTKSKLNPDYQAPATNYPQPIVFKKSSLLPIAEEEHVNEEPESIFDNFNNEMLKTLRSINEKDTLFKNALAIKLDNLVDTAIIEFKLAKAGHSKHKTKLFDILDEMKKHISECTDKKFIDVSYKQIEALRENLFNSLPSAEAASPPPIRSMSAPL